MTDATPTLRRPRFHLFRLDPADADADPEFVATMAITNRDQLLAEKQGKALGLGDGRTMPMHLTALWVWAAAVRLDLTSAKFKDFGDQFEWDAAKAPEADDPEAGEGEDVDPTFTDPGASIDSA